jgi:hypothetical protein
MDPPMKALVLIFASGCATTWAVSQAVDRPQMWDEGVREVRVPEAGITERVSISMPLAIEYEPPPWTPAGQPPPPRVAKPFEITCSTDQDAHDAVYHSAFRYGSRWKKMTAIAFLTEAAAAALLYAAKTDDHPEDYVYAGFFAADALVTGALFFAPRKEIYRRDENPVTTHVRSDCPEGMSLAIAGSEYPVNAAGRLGELGEAALDQWMGSGGEPVEVRVVGQSRQLALGPDERCMWQREHHQAVCNAPAMPRAATASFVVEPGLLARE